MIDPFVLQGGRSASAEVLDTIAEFQQLAGQHALRNLHVHDLQVGRGTQLDMKRHHRDIVALVAVLLNGIRIPGAETDGLHGGKVGHRAVDYLADDVGVGVDENMVVAFQSFG